MKFEYAVKIFSTACSTGLQVDEDDLVLPMVDNFAGRLPSAQRR
jgi:hypothetical protein